MSPLVLTPGPVHGVPVLLVTMLFRTVVGPSDVMIPVVAMLAVTVLYSMKEGVAGLANEMAKALLAEGIYVIGFSYPVVPKGEARIRVQLSAAHETEHVDQAIEAFQTVGRRLGVVA